MPPDETEEHPAKGTDNEPERIERAAPPVPPVGVSLDQALLTNTTIPDRNSSGATERLPVPQPPASENPLKNRPAPLDLERTREKTRQQLATFLFAAYAFTNLAAVTIVGIDFFRSQNKTESSNLLTLLLTSQTTLLGTALGFYFGDRKSDRE